MVHKCYSYLGKPYIKDVSVRNGFILCRACEQVLKDEEVEPSILKKIRDKEK